MELKFNPDIELLSSFLHRVKERRTQKAWRRTVKEKKKLKVKVNTLREKFLSPFPSNSDIGLLRSIYNRFGNLSNVYRIRKPAQCNCIRPIITFHSLYILVTSSSFVSQTFGVRSVKKSLAFFFFFRLTIGSSLIRNFILKIYFQKKKKL